MLCEEWGRKVSVDINIVFFVWFLCSVYHFHDFFPLIYLVFYIHVIIFKMFLMVTVFATSNAVDVVLLDRHPRHGFVSVFAKDAAWPRGRCPSA